MKPDTSLTLRPSLVSSLQIPATVAVLATTLLLPWAVHALPAMGGVPWGARLLPMFFAPFVGVFFFRLHVGLVPALLAPGLSLLVAGMPEVAVAARLTFDLTVFTLVAWLFVHRAKGRLGTSWIAAPLAYLVVKILTEPILQFVPVLHGPDGGATLSGYAFPGIILLGLLNAVLVQLRRRADG